MLEAQRLEHGRGRKSARQEGSVGTDRKMTWGAGSRAGQLREESLLPSLSFLTGK